jgi:hypothetical protein
VACVEHHGLAEHESKPEHGRGDEADATLEPERSERSDLIGRLGLELYAVHHIGELDES